MTKCKKCKKKNDFGILYEKCYGVEWDEADKKIKEIIETHGLMLLSLYGVSEKRVVKDYSAVRVFVENLCRDLIKLLRVK